MINFNPEKYLSNNTQRAIFMVILSTILWLTVKLQSTYETDVVIPLKVSAVPQDSILKYKLIDKIKINIQGTGANLIRMGLYKPQAVINCIGLGDSSSLDMSSPNLHITLPPSVKFRALRLLNPQKIQVVLEKSLTKVLQIKHNAHINTKAGYIVTDLTTEPDTVVVTGAYSVVKKMDTMSTVSVKYKNKNSDFSEVVKLNIPENYNLLTNVHEVLLKADVQKLGEVTLENVPLRVINVPSYRKVIPLPSEITLTVKGGTDILAGIAKDNFEVYLDFNEYRPGQKLRPQIKYDLNIESVTVYPTEFELIILRR